VRTSIRTQLLISLLVIAIAAAGPLSWYFLEEVQAYGIRKLEERLTAEARLLTAIAAETGLEDRETLSAALRESALEVNSNLAILKPDGVPVAVSGNLAASGSGLGDLPEVRSAMEGSVGVESRPGTDGRIRLTVALPMLDNGDVIGIAVASAETFSRLTLLRDHAATLMLLAVIFTLATFMLAEILSRWLARPLRNIASSAQMFAAGDLGVRVLPQGPQETRTAAEAFNTMADQVSEMVDELRREERRKSRFVSDVSHEIRSPLTAIRGTAETLAQGDVEPEDTKRFLATIVKESERLSRLAEDLLALQRIEGATGELPMRRARLRSIVLGAVDSLEHTTSERGIDVRVSGDAPDVLGDPDRLQQVIANLLDNASRHTPRGGAVTLEMRHEGAFSVVTVSDEGPGIDEESLPHIFDRFYRTSASRDRTTGGAGLGLAIVQSIVSRHAGEIDVENLTPNGTCFTVRLPALKD